MLRLSRGLVTVAVRELLHCSRPSGDIAHLLVEFRGSRYGVVPTRGPRVAAQQPPTGQPGALERTVDLHRPQRVRRTARVVTADVPVQRADHQPVSLEQPDQDILHRWPALATARDQAEARSGARSDGTAAACGNARTTRSKPTGVWASCSAARCRSRRLTRLRVTALPTCLETTKPTRTDAPCERPACTTSVGRPARAPALVVRRKSSELLIRAERGSTSGRNRSDRNRSGRQLGATFAPASGQDRTAGASPHPEAEAVGAAATPIARLERTLAHGKTPS